MSHDFTITNPLHSSSPPYPVDQLVDACCNEPQTIRAALAAFSRGVASVGVASVAGGVVAGVVSVSGWSSDLDDAHPDTSMRWGAFETMTAVNRPTTGMIARDALFASMEAELFEKVESSNADNAYDLVTEWLCQRGITSGFLRYLESESPGRHRALALGAICDSDVEVDGQLAPVLLQLLGSNDKKLARISAAALAGSRFRSDLEKWIGQQPKESAVALLNFLQFANA